MPLAVTHILLTIILVDLYRDYVAKHRRFFTLHTLVIAGIAGLLPDIDIPINWLLSIFGANLTHGTITHVPILGLMFLIPAFILLRKEKHKTAMYFFVICFGILFHILLDYFLGGGTWEGIMLLWPLSTQAFKIHLLSKIGLENIPAAIDALVLLGWLWHEEIKHKIKDFF